MLRALQRFRDYYSTSPMPTSVKYTYSWYNCAMIHCISNDEAVQALVNGNVGILPTDTVYGIVARAQDQQAVGRLYKLKHRERKPGTIIAASVDQLIALGLETSILHRVAHVWPNSLSIIIPTSPALSYLDQAVGSLAVRIPSDENIRAMLEQTGPLVTSSANKPGEPTAETIQEAHAYFGDAVDFYVDGGRTEHVIPSTIIRIEADNHVTVVREGAVPKERLPQAI